MPYPIQSYFNPSDRYKQTWSLVPQVRTLSVSGHKARAMYSELSSSVPIFYVFMFLAISFDVYLAFSILAKSGVSYALVVGSVLADLLLAVGPFLIESYLLKHLNHVRLENQIFQKELECKTMKKGESQAEFETRRSHIKEGDLKKFQRNKQIGKFVRFVLILLILLIAGWKIFTFYKVLPPGINIFSLVNGKIVIIFSLLCAIFHIIGSEKAFAHLMFKLTSVPEFNLHKRTHGSQVPVPTQLEMEYQGTYVDVKSGNTGIVNRKGKVFLEFIHIIWDNEIQALVNAQTDEMAKRGIAIKCKDNQLI